jgi:hypothetical protein
MKNLVIASRCAATLFCISRANVLDVREITALFSSSSPHQSSIASYRETASHA